MLNGPSSQSFRHDRGPPAVRLSRRSLLGHIPDPESGKASINKPYAKHYIDTLEMLSEKTKGNLSDDESAMISEALHTLRMAYVNAKST